MEFYNKKKKNMFNFSLNQISNYSKKLAERL